ncbi:MAG: hypothetical protein GX421_06480 [Caldisericales bacterium]|nr:hypothetical protein [Caldisericales bacterium]
MKSRFGWTINALLESSLAYMCTTVCFAVFGGNIGIVVSKTSFLAGWLVFLGLFVVLGFVFGKKLHENQILSFFGFANPRKSSFMMTLVLSAGLGLVSWALTLVCHELANLITGQTVVGAIFNQTGPILLCTGSFAISGALVWTRNMLFANSPISKTSNARRK